MSLYALARLLRGEGSGSGGGSSNGQVVQLPPSFLDAFMAASALQLQYCSCQALSNIIWGLATILIETQGKVDEEGTVCFSSSLPPSAWLGAFVSSSGACMGMFSNQELSLTAWALGRLGWQPGEEWMGKLEVRPSATHDPGIGGCLGCFFLKRNRVCCTVSEFPDVSWAPCPPTADGNCGAGPLYEWPGPELGPLCDGEPRAQPQSRDFTKHLGWPAFIPIYCRRSAFIPILCQGWSWAREHPRDPIKGPE